MFAAAVQRLYATPWLLLTLTTLGWGGNAVAGQLAVGHVLPFQLVLLRWLLVSVALWFLLGHEVRAHWSTIRPKLPLIVFMATIGFTTFNALFYLASYETSAVNIGILQGSIPVFVMLGAFGFFGTKISAIQAIGVVMTLTGVVIVATGGDPAALLKQALNRGDLIMLVACFCYAIYTLALKVRPNIPGNAFFAVMAPIAAITSLPFAVGEAVVEGMTYPTMTGWIVTLFIAIFPSCLSQLFFLRAVDLIGPGRAAVYANLVPVFAAILAVLILGEVFAFYHALSLALVIGGIALAQRAAPPPATKARAG